MTDKGCCGAVTTEYTVWCYECSDRRWAQKLGFRLGNAIKYISRAGKKDKTKIIEDLEKARVYLSREILMLRLEAGLPAEEPPK